MNAYVTGAIIKKLREEKSITQAELAEKLDVTNKAVSKWETGKGLPDVSLIAPLATALGVSVPELMSGEAITNKNRAGNLSRAKFYVCPICGNILFSMGEMAASCCGISLPPLEAEDLDETHTVTIEDVEDEQFITVSHPMSRDHYISFIAYVYSDKFQLIKLYPEGNAECRLTLRGRGTLYLYCNKHGLMKRKV